MLLPSDKIVDKQLTQFFKRTYSIRRYLAEPYLCWPFEGGREGPTHNLVRDSLKVDEMDVKLLLAAFHNGVNSNLFIHKLYEQEPQTMAEFVHSAQNFMNA